MATTHSRHLVQYGTLRIPGPEEGRDVGIDYGTSRGLSPQHALEFWDNRVPLRIPGPKQTRDDDSERWPDEWPLNEEPPNEEPSNEQPSNEQPSNDEIPNEDPPTLDTWSSRSLFDSYRPDQVRDDESERWPDEWPPDEQPPRTVRFNTPSPPPTPPPPYTEIPPYTEPPPYTELPPARPVNREQAHKKLSKLQPQAAKVSLRKRCLARLKPKVAAFGHHVKTRWLPAMREEFIIFLTYLSGYDENGKPLTSLVLR